MRGRAGNCASVRKRRSQVGSWKNCRGNSEGPDREEHTRSRFGCYLKLMTLFPKPLSMRQCCQLKKRSDAPEPSSPRKVAREARRKESFCQTFLQRLLESTPSVSFADSSHIEGAFCCLLPLQCQGLS